ncbi:glycosyltransferase family 4 protein [Paramagnetospirillum magneticum]|uniref:Glycosyltransferase n=1 Tax=Paramagnetospirillum magneticum (strain ATCC 700264 / AMB-1) TaxID=342108 RepID=Q2WB26_PARM1|nr:glycosyltransferase family 4 protein [Paramagnetospirillum magneticum]BAE48949.1 Glycosyltransferase [Paramagnetospirillum magneticum AMB-1]
MRILFLTENYPPETNAAATRVSERAAYWIKAGHQVTVLTSAPNFPGGRLFEGWRNDWRQISVVDGIRVVRVKTYIAPNEGFAKRILDFLSFMVSAFIAGLFEARPDVVVSTSPQFFAAVGGWALAAVRRVPFVFELGDLWPRSITAVGAMKDSPVIRAIEALELFLYRRSAAVVALTRAFKADLIARRIPAEKIAVVINGVDLPRYAPRPRDEALEAEWGLKDKFVIGYVGTHGMAHGLINVLDAALRLKDTAPHIRFLLVGNGAERQMLKDEAARRGLANVVFGPPQPKERMPAVWSLCDVALIHLKDSPAFAEVIPSKMFEAMGMGLPLLLVAPRGEASHIVEADRAGLFVPAADPDGLAAAARRLADDAAERKTLAAASLEAASSHTRQRQADLFIRVLELVVAGRGSAEAGTIEG